MRISDWSSDVCSSDLCAVTAPAIPSAATAGSRTSGRKRGSRRMMCALLAKQAWKSKRDVVRRVDMNDTSEGHSPYSYADAGVSIAAGNALVKAIAPLARATRRPGADADLGGFGRLFDLKAAGFTKPEAHP